MAEFNYCELLQLRFGQRAKLAHRRTQNAKPFGHLLGHCGEMGLGMLGGSNLAPVRTGMCSLPYCRSLR